MNIRDFDLNTLRALEALLHHRGVNRAATALRLSQPATSHALKRLRAQLGDPLLVRAGNQMELTPHAESLLGPVQEILRDVQSLLDRAAFDPGSTNRVFSLTSHDLLAPLVSHVLQRMRQDAPGSRLEQYLPPGPGLETSGLVDLGPTANAEPHAIAARLGTLSWSIVARRGHPLARGTFGVAEWTRYPHIIVRTGYDSEGFVQRVLNSHGIKRDVAYVSPNFMTVPQVLAESDLLFVAMTELILPLTERFGLTVLPLPVEVPSVPISMRWHPRNTEDAGHRWFRSLLGETTRDALGSCDAPPNAPPNHAICVD